MYKKRCKLTILIISIFFILLNFAYASSQPSVIITASPTTVQVNDIITLTVTGNDDNGLYTISAKIMGSYLDYNCNGNTFCTHKWYTSYPSSTLVQPEAKACDIDNQCAQTFATISVVNPDSDDSPQIQDKSVSPSNLKIDETITITISATDDRNVDKISYRKSGGSWNDFDCNSDENPIFCEHTFTTSESSSGTYNYEARVVDSSNHITTATIGGVTVTQQQSCPTCNQPTLWTACINSKQNRTNYKCDSSTNYICQSYIEIQSCTQSQICTEAWECSDWSACANSKQARTCNDVNNCGTILNKPALAQTCSVKENQIACIENWICAPEWSPCINGNKTRECYDTNGCSQPKIENISCNDGLITKEVIK
jgi:hypothetical protein